MIYVDKVKNKYREQILISNKLIKLLKIVIVLFLIIRIKINFLLKDFLIILDGIKLLD
jgi:hypothetical protein